MTTSASTPADIVNASLLRVGYKNQIGNLYDGSEAAQVALALYGQTRDNLIRMGDWGFAQREILLTLLKFAPASYVPGVTDWDPATYPQLGYKYEYAFPDNCLKIRALRPVPIYVPEIDPSPWSFSIANDPYYTPARRVILTNLQNASAVYAGRVTDPTTWPVDFTESLIETLAEPLAAALTNPELGKVEAAEARMDTAMANMEQG